MIARRFRPEAVTRAAIACIGLYQRASRLWPRVCRFYPTCSQYAADALAEHGLAEGGKLALRRLCRCHPWHPGGLDPVPARSPQELSLQ